MKIPGEKKEVVVRTVYKLAGVKCDVCGRVIEPPTKENRYHWMDNDYKYYSVTTGHNDWGNDSCESIKHYDVCPDCINKFVAEYLGDKKVIDQPILRSRQSMSITIMKWMRRIKQCLTIFVGGTSGEKDV